MKLKDTLKLYFNMIKLRDYQEKTYELIKKSIDLKFSKNKISRIAVFLPTGAGKSVIIGKIAESIKLRALILTNRFEILKQNRAWLGDDCGILTAGVNDVNETHRVVIAMVETLRSRIKKYGNNFLGSFDVIIIDEAHINVFKKVYDEYNYKILIGLTATPLFNKKVYKTINEIRYQRQLVFGDFYDEIIQGVSTQDLIDLNFLTQEYNIVLQKGVTKKLKSSNTTPDGYTVESLDAQYTNTASLNTLKDAYIKYGLGKKTIIFNPSTKVSDFAYKALKDIAINIRSFDVRSGKNKREEVLKWYRETKDAVLINVNVFTTGFDEADIECVILNRATKSLSLYHQMVGRGSRIGKLVLKDYFTVVDLGDNVYNHGVWSKDIDWSNYFYAGDFVASRSLSIIETWDCVVCGNINPLIEFTCECGNTIEDNKEDGEVKKVTTRGGSLVAMQKIPKPNGKSIVDYTIKNGEDANFAFKIAERKIINLFTHYKIDEDFYNKNKERFLNRSYDIFRPIYFCIINSKLTGANKKLDTMKERLKTKIEKIWYL